MDSNTVASIVGLALVVLHGAFPQGAHANLTPRIVVNNDHSGMVAQISVSESGLIVTCSKDGSVIIWNARFQKLFEHQFSTPIVAACANIDGSSLFAASSDGHLYCLSIRDRDQFELPTMCQEIQSMKWLAPNNLVVVGQCKSKLPNLLKDLECRVEKWNVQSKELVSDWLYFDSSIVAADLNNSHGIALLHSGQLQTWDVSSMRFSLSIFDFGSCQLGKCRLGEESDSALVLLGRDQAILLKRIGEQWETFKDFQLGEQLTDGVLVAQHRAAVVGESGRVAVVDFETNSIRHLFKAETGSALGRTASEVLAGTFKGKLYGTTHSDEVRRFEQIDLHWTVTALDLAARRLAVASDRLMTIWNFTDGIPVSYNIDADSSIEQCCWVDDRLLAFSVGKDLWLLDTAQSNHRIVDQFSDRIVGLQRVNNREVSVHTSVEDLFVFDVKNETSSKIGIRNRWLPNVKRLALRSHGIDFSASGTTLKATEVQTGYTKTLVCDGGGITRLYVCRGIEDWLVCASESGLITAFQLNSIMQSENRLVIYAGREEWFIAYTTGQFDTSSFDNADAFGWVVQGEELTHISPAIFARHLFTPRLLTSQNPIEIPLQDLNRVQPKVGIVGIERIGESDEVEVTVEVSGASDEFGFGDQKRTMSTGVYDLRLFRDGQIVGQSPPTAAEVSLPTIARTEEEREQWRLHSKVCSSDVQRGQVNFRVTLPRNLAGEKIEFTAYAFNRDRVKSETAKACFLVPDDLKKVTPRAFLIGIGVDQYEGRVVGNLNFAAADARLILDDLKPRFEKLDYQVHTTALISASERKPGERLATKAQIRDAILDLKKQASGSVDL